MKRTMKQLLTWMLLALLVLPLVACAASGNEDYLGGDPGGNYYPNEEFENVVDGMSPGEPDGEHEFAENPFINTDEQNVSTLSADVDTASYTYFRKLVNTGYAWSELKQTPKAFRTEEFLNYFRYDAPTPEASKLFALRSMAFPCPWNSQNVLLSMTLQAKTATPAMGQNLVFLIDVSGSMSSSDKLPLLQNTFSHLVDHLSANDIISIVTYSGSERVVLDGCKGNKKETILNAIRSLSASGSTNGEAGLQKAYQLAEKYRIEGGNNRIILASDGDLNVGISSVSELEIYIAQKRDTGIFLSVLGFGTGNYRDSKMETIADCGNGVYLYVDGESEAEKIFSTDLFSNLYTIAKDVKMQVTFNPQTVTSYRLIGYENRILNEEDFTDDTKDAGEVGAGHQVTFCYELTLAEGAFAEAANWLELAVNYKHPDQSTSVLPNVHFIGSDCYSASPNEDAVFMSALIETCMLLRNSQYLTEDITGTSIANKLALLDLSAHPERAEFLQLLQALNQKEETKHQ